MSEETSESGYKPASQKQSLNDDSASTAVLAQPAQALLPAASVTQRWQWSPWVIWLIPVFAAAIAGYLVIHAMLERGSTITISFKSAEGLEAGKTKLKFKDVDIGDVKSISLSKDRTQVIVKAQLVKGAANFARDDTVFWVVRPRIGAGGISGLSTLLSGAYIAVDVGKAEIERDDFVGLDAPPPITNGLAGRHFILHSEQIGSLDVGAPLYYRRLQVGQVISYELDRNGRGFTFNVFVNAPYDQYVRQNSLFSHASGVELSLDSNGIKLQTESLASILSGGISFETPADNSLPQAAANAEFTLFPSRQKALQHPDFEVRAGLMYFNESVRGLNVGAPLDFRGIVIGEVKAIKLEYDKTKHTYRFPVEVYLYPQRLRSYLRPAPGKEKSDDEDIDQLLDRLQQAGLRAQLKTGNLLTGSMFIALDVAQQGKAKADVKSATSGKANAYTSDAPMLIATIPGGLDQLQAAVISIANKVDKLPISEMGSDVRTALASLNSSLQSADKLFKNLDSDLAPQASKTLSQVRQTLSGVDKVLAEDGVQLDLKEALREIKRAAHTLNSLADTLERHPEALIRGKQEDKR